MASYEILNAPKELDMLTFKGAMEQFGGLQKSCRYVARMSIPRILYPYTSPAFVNDMMYLCEATELPGRSFNNIDVRYYGPNQKVPFQSVYEDINMTFICRNQSLERQYFDDWQWFMNPTTTFDFNYRDDYAAQIDLFTISDIEDSDYGDPGPMDETDTGPTEAPHSLATYQFSLIDAFPVMVNPQPVTWADGDFLRLTVTFTYSHWRRPVREPDAQSIRMVVGNVGVEQPNGPASNPRNPVIGD